ncbi:MAG: hypothetical protein HQL70_05215 [Magnetococcales bacterium]|nr:hypothetical protein [Magnetococcales bacterium]
MSAAASGMELIKDADVKETPETPGYTRVIAKQRQDKKDEGSSFVRFMPDGSLSIIKKEVKEVPKIDEEEVQKRRWEKIEREIYQKAFAEGEKTGIEIGQEKMEQEIQRIIPQLESVLRELDNLPHRVFTSTENFLVESLISFNRELLAHELTINPAGIAARVTRILDRSIGRKDIIIRVSPESAKILERLDQFKKLQIFADNSVAPGSVVMESDFGGIEDNIEARLREVETALRQQLQDRLDQSGLTEIADAARQKAEAEKNAPITPLVEKPEPMDEDGLEFEADDEFGDDDEFPLETVGDDLLSLDSEEGSDTEDDFPLDATSGELDDFPLDATSGELDDFPLDTVSDEAVNSFLDQDDALESSAAAEPNQEDEEWSALDEDGVESGDSKTDLSSDESITPTDEDQNQ